MADYTTTEEFRWLWMSKMSFKQGILDKVNKVLEHFSKKHSCVILPSYRLLESKLMNTRCNTGKLNTVLEIIERDTYVCDKVNRIIGYSSPVPKSDLERILIRILEIIGPYCLTEKIQDEMKFADFSCQTVSETETATVLLPPPTHYQDIGRKYNFDKNVGSFPIDFYQTVLEEPSAPPCDAKKKEKFSVIKKLFSPKRRTKNSGL